MVHPLDENLDPTFEELYQELYLFDEDDPDGEGYFIKNAKRCFPSILTDVDEFNVLVRVMAWAVARSYQQPIILRYIYDPDLVLDVLLPRLADTLDFSLPINYPVEDVRMIIKYLQKIRRIRGTFNSVKQLIRILNVSRREILEMPWNSYGSVDVVQDSDYAGVLYVQYNNIYDLDFALHMLRYVMPAGYKFFVESGLDTWGYIGTVYRNKYDQVSYSIFQKVDRKEVFRDHASVEYHVKIMKNDTVNMPGGT